MWNARRSTYLAGCPWFIQQKVLTKLFISHGSRNSNSFWKSMFVWHFHFVVSWIIFVCKTSLVVPPAFTLSFKLLYMPKNTLPFIPISLAIVMVHYYWSLFIYVYICICVYIIKYNLGETNNRCPSSKWEAATHHTKIIVINYATSHFIITAIHSFARVHQYHFYQHHESHDTSQLFYFQNLKIHYSWGLTWPTCNKPLTNRAWVHNTLLLLLAIPCHHKNGEKAFVFDNYNSCFTPKLTTWKGKRKRLQLSW